MNALILFPHQLDSEHAALENYKRVILVEEFLFFNQYPFHKQKIAFHRASMKSFSDSLPKHEVHYIEAITSESDIRKLLPKLKTDGYTTIAFIDPCDYLLEKRLTSSAQDQDIDLIKYDATLFINTPKDLTTYFRPEKKKFFQTAFYKNERKRLGLMIDENGNPQGGKWTYDIDNRKKYPKDKVPPNIYFPEPDKHWDEAVTYVNAHFKDNYGELSDLYYPYNKEESEKWLEQFLEYRFAEFGPYEDAIVRDASFLHHSILTPMLNVGLIKPSNIIDRAVKHAAENDIPIQSLEGFVRQIAGWREFMRGMYISKGDEMRTKNYWSFNRKIPASFYNGTTGIPPIDSCIKQILKTGYCHHIERLMVLGNFMLLCEFDPDDVYQWFMELFIDAYDWVMVPNVYAMSQFADGGLFATKPYISSSNYIKKMSNFKGGDWEATWDGLFWRFMHKQRWFFESNPRLGLLLKNLDKMGEEKLQRHIKNADNYLLSLD